MTRAVPLAQMNSGVVVDGASGSSKSFFGTTAGNPRWEMRLGNATAEPGSGNVGSDFNIARYNDAGAVLDTPLTISRATGLLALSGDPTAALGVASKQYVDANARIGDNRIINGDMRIDQRNNGASGTATGYTIDRWQYAASQANKVAWSRVSGPTNLGFPYAFAITSQSAFTSAASDYFQLFQVIEADMVSDFAWGTPQAQPVTLSFWALGTVAGAYSASVLNAATNRSYPFSFILPTNAWTKITVTIPGDTAGTWTLSGNAAGLSLRFDLGNGPTNRGPANAWASAGYIGVTGAASLVATNGANFSVTGVKLEIGSVATPFNRQSLAKSMIDCQRYYQLGQLIIGGWGGAANMNIFWSSLFPVVMRASPTIIAATVNLTNSAFDAAGAYGGSAVWLQAHALAIAGYNSSMNFYASAEL